MSTAFKSQGFPLIFTKREQSGAKFVCVWLSTLNCNKVFIKVFVFVDYLVLKVILCNLEHSVMVFWTNLYKTNNGFTRPKLQKADQVSMFLFAHQHFLYNFTE